MTYDFDDVQRRIIARFGANVGYLSRPSRGLATRAMLREFLMDALSAHEINAEASLAEEPDE